MIDLYAFWIINGQGQVNGNDSAGLGSFIIDTLQESDTHGHRGKIFSELDINLLFLHIQTANTCDLYLCLLKMFLYLMVLCVLNEI